MKNGQKVAEKSVKSGGSLVDLPFNAVDKLIKTISK